MENKNDLTKYFASLNESVCRNTWNKANYGISTNGSLLSGIVEEFDNGFSQSIFGIFTHKFGKRSWKIALWNIPRWYVPNQVYRRVAIVEQGY